MNLELKKHMTLLQRQIESRGKKISALQKKNLCVPVLDTGTHITQISRFCHKTFSLKSDTVQLKCLYSDVAGVLIKIYRDGM